jgi:hypothetical protein
MASTIPESAMPIMDAGKTSIVVRFKAAPGVTTEQYDECIRRLETSGDWLPDGLDYHVAFRSNGDFRVSEVWDSRAQLDAFGKRLMPLLKDLGIELAGEPEILEIHNTLKR